MTATFFVPLLILSVAAPALDDCVTHQALPRRAPLADLSDLKWLEGSWSGEGIDGALATEVYSAPAGGQMVGHFRQLASDGSVLFYELITITQVGDTIEYRLKHFDADLTGWETQKQVRRFPLLCTTGDSWKFEGLIIRREAVDRMNITVRVRQDDGTDDSLEFRYRRSR